MIEQGADRSGQVLGPYQLTHLLGTGGFGEVYEANHRLLQQKRAIKLLRERHFHDPNQRERFLREVRTLATLEHPNVLPVLEVGEEGNVLYLVMPFYHRGTLNDLLKQCTTPLPLAEVERFLAQICAAVDYAHAKSIAHLDLKPDNMLLHEDGRLVLSDFGLAHLIKQGRLEAGSSASWGTPYYMAPEQIRGEPDLCSDLYALGVILYQLLTKQRPFTGTTPEAVMMKHLLEAPPPLHSVSPEAPVTLEPVIQKALEKKPEDRYPTAEALLADFRAAVSGSSSRLGQMRATDTPPAPIVQTTKPMPPEHTAHAVEPVNVTKGVAALCEIELNDGQHCGVAAIGRCGTCGHAYCRSHHVSGRYDFVNQCAPCAKAEDAERRWLFQKTLDAEKYILSGAARTALFASGVQPVNIHQLERILKIGIFRERWIDTVISEQGWILGEFRWERIGKYNVSGTGVEEKRLTALLDASSPGSRLVQVQPYSEGYKIVAYSGGYNVIEGDGKSQVKFKDWLELVQAIRQLTGD